MKKKAAGRSPLAGIERMRRLLPLALALFSACAQTQQPPATPTATPSPPPTPFARWASPKAIEAFKAAGLEAEQMSVITQDEMNNAPLPKTMKEGTRFLVPSICRDCGGRVFSFENQADLDSVKHYYEGLGRASGMFASWVYVKGNLLVQINGQLPEAKAKKYEQALNNLN